LFEVAGLRFNFQPVTFNFPLFPLQRILQFTASGLIGFIRKFACAMQVIQRDEQLKANLLGNSDDASMIRPVFYNQIDSERLKVLIAGDGLFRIEGTEKGVNYTRT
jgi:hypothetical protein